MNMFLWKSMTLSHNIDFLGVKCLFFIYVTYTSVTFKWCINYSRILKSDLKPRTHLSRAHI